jgi:hypothetical protein
MPLVSDVWWERSVVSRGVSSDGNELICPRLVVGSGITLTR